MENCEHAGRQILAAAQTLAKNNPGKAVTVTVCAAVYHTPSQSPDILNWGVSIGHSATFSGPSLAATIAKLKHAESAEAKKEKAAELRREAALLEESAAQQKAL